jgi:hypothetical protein
MDELLNVVIVLGRCSRSARLYGIRFEEKGRGSWVADWAFPIKEQTAHRERFDRGDITGSFMFAVGYPGCPGCGAPSVFRCSCGKVACWDGKGQAVTCPWCRGSVRLVRTVDRLTASGDA